MTILIWSTLFVGFLWVQYLPVLASNEPSLAYFKPTYLKSPKYMNAAESVSPSAIYYKPKYYKMKPVTMIKTASKYYKKHQPPFPYKKVKHHHYHPIVLYKKKRIPGKYWHEAQRRLVTKHGGLDILGDIIQLPNGRILEGNLGQNVPNFNDGYFKPWELRARLMKMQRDFIKSLLKQIVRMIRERPPKGTFLVKEIDLLD